MSRWFRYICSLIQNQTSFTQTNRFLPSKVVKISSSELYRRLYEWYQVEHEKLMSECKCHLAQECRLRCHPLSLVFSPLFRRNYDFRAKKRAFIYIALWCSKKVQKPRKVYHKSRASRASYFMHKRPIITR